MGRELAARLVEGGLGLGPLEVALQVDRGGEWVHREVGRGDGAPCQPSWHSQDRGLPTVASATALFLCLRLRAGFVGVTWGWPQVPGVLPWSRYQESTQTGVFRGLERRIWRNLINCLTV